MKRLSGVITLSYAVLLATTLLSAQEPLETSFVAARDLIRPGIQVDAALRPQKIETAKNECRPDSDEAFRILYNRRFGTFTVAQHDSRSEPADQVGLTENERVAIWCYTQGAYDVNAALRSGGQEIGELNPFIASLACGLSKLPDYQGEVFRITKLPDHLLTQYQEGSVVTDAGFVSTYRDLRLPPTPGTSPHAMYIFSKTGKDITQLSSYHGQEREVLFTAGTRFRILTRTQNPDGTVILKMEEVDPTPKAQSAPRESLRGQVGWSR